MSRLPRKKPTSETLSVDTPIPFTVVPEKKRRNHAGTKQTGDLASLIANDDAMLTFEQLGDWLQISSKRARAMVDKDFAFKAVPVTPKLRRVRVKDVKAWLQKQADVRIGDRHSSRGRGAR